MDDDEKINPLDKLSKIISFFDEKQKEHLELAMISGKARDDLKSAFPLIAVLEEINSDDTEYINLRTLQMDSLNDLYDYTQGFTPIDQSANSNLRFAAGTAESFVTTSGSTSVFYPELESTLSETAYDNLLSFTPSILNNLGERLLNFDRDLGKTYNEIWETLYGTRSDPERAALYSIRQVFDHLFYKLAPDDEVRKSPYWKKKTNDKPNQIHRLERIEFAANRHIRDNRKRKVLLSTSRHMLETYEQLNRAHTRGELNKDKARAVLKEMQSFLELWADGLNL